MKVDIKRYAKVEKIPGGEIANCPFQNESSHRKRRGGWIGEDEGEGCVGFGGGEVACAVLQN